jgi:putative transposase
LIFQTVDGTYNTERLITFLEELKQQMGGQKVILIWDGLPAHRSRHMNEYLRAQRNWLQVERLPGYAPDLNPVETLWANVKGQELANRCAANLGEVVSALTRGLERVLRSPHLPLSFLHHAGLYFWLYSRIYG